MKTEQNSLLNHKLANGWRLFWLVSAPLSLAMLLAMTQVDLAAPEGVSSMIQLSVRCAVPWLYLAFAASSLATVFPGSFSRWLLRNRKYVGLCFAAAMAWQLLFILWLVGIHTEYYVNDVYILSDVVEGVTGYAFLIAMTLTSFRFGRRRLTAKQWKLLHTMGIYWLWFYAWSVYWFNLFYYQSPAVLIDYVYYWGGLTAWGLRVLAWSRQRRRKSQTEPGARDAGVNFYLVIGVAAIVTGIAGSGFGSAWSPRVYDFLFAFPIVEMMDAFMPYFPLVPFYPLLVILFGAFFLSKSSA
jgi:hypothetical protein